jgi:MoaA/NifB/PqqE/SkfB family radical SAM enzyme
MKRSNKLRLRWREIRMIARGLVSTKHVLLAHIIPIRRCNLACTYCNEYDDFSPPVPTDEMLRRIDRLAYLRTSIVTISGGEPLMHPQIEAIIKRIRRHGMIAGLITNGYLLTPKKILALNEAGLEHLQISIDNIQPDDVSNKSLKVLDKKLKYLADYAEFAVNINSVIGGGIRNPEDAEVITRRAVELGFSSSLGIIHDGNGSVKPLNRREERVYQEIKTYGKQSYSRF